jgi:hypothetical protein
MAKKRQPDYMSTKDDYRPTKADYEGAKKEFGVRKDLKGAKARYWKKRRAVDYAAEHEKGDLRPFEKNSASETIKRMQQREGRKAGDKEKDSWYEPSEAQLKAWIKTERLAKQRESEKELDKYAGKRERGTTFKSGSAFQVGRSSSSKKRTRKSAARKR